MADTAGHLRAEHTRKGSTLFGRLSGKVAVQGFSIGGGGAQLAAVLDASINAVIALSPHDGKHPLGCV